VETAVKTEVEVILIKVVVVLIKVVVVVIKGWWY